MAAVPDVAPDRALIEADPRNPPLPARYVHVVDFVDVASITALALLKLIVRSLHSAELIRVARFGNRAQWEGYQRCKSKVARDNGGNPNVCFGFHGTADPRKILGDGLGNCDGFRPAFSRGGAYGHGAYFAKEAAYSVLIHPRAANDDGSFSLLVVELALGAVYDFGDALAEDLKHPPVRVAHARLNFDSVTGTEKGIGLRSRTSRLASGAQFVIYDKDQAYAHYLVTFCVRPSIPVSPSGLTFETLSPGCTVTLYSFRHRRYVQMTKDFAVVSRAHPDADQLSHWQQSEAFEVVRGGDNGEVALYSHYCGRFVRMYKDMGHGQYVVDGKGDLHGRGGRMSRDELPAEDWQAERWVARPVGEGKVSLYSRINERFMSMSACGAVCGDADTKAGPDVGTSEREQFIAIARN